MLIDFIGRKLPRSENNWEHNFIRDAFFPKPISLWDNLALVAEIAIAWEMVYVHLKSTLK